VAVILPDQSRPWDSHAKRKRRAWLAPSAALGFEFLSDPQAARPTFRLTAPERRKHEKGGDFEKGSCRRKCFDVIAGTLKQPDEILAGAWSPSTTYTGEPS
jgi:hypothetical protein